MKKKIFSVVATLLLSCCFAFAQNGGMQVELKPYKPPYGDIVEYPKDTVTQKNPFSLTKQIIFDCYQNSTHHYRLHIRSIMYNL